MTRRSDRHSAGGLSIDACSILAYTDQNASTNYWRYKVPSRIAKYGLGSNVRNIGQPLRRRQLNGGDIK